ncbi:apolipoprotein L3-like isoform X4 [Sceloporus undulatus]|uniref:apolipoprotein L3-like isoform X4 n=1 Tax=Sceloporus undulatus TaxID=8520 RepID=UPI001C4DB774|nr:apolipoprotein L3-like isoform X4 [Sceloporus undulatus]
MPLKNCQVYKEELEYDKFLGISEGLVDELNNDKVGDGDYYMEMVKDNNELERFYLACFMKEFPAQREKIEKSIQCLREIADDIDKTHKKCTIASIATNFTGASSGIMNIVGLTLAPFTAGGSLILTATGFGLGAVAAVTGMSTVIYEHGNNSKEKKRAQELISECQKCLRNVLPTSGIDFSSQCPLNNGAVGENVKQLVSNVASQVPKMYRAAKGIKSNVKALKLARNNPGLKALAKRATAVGSTSQRTIRGVKNVEKAFGGTALAMTRGARMLSAATAGVFLLFDAYGIAQDAKHLTQGAKAETAAEIREEAYNLEKQLYNLNRMYEELKDMICRI